MCARSSTTHMMLGVKRSLKSRALGLLGQKEIATKNTYLVLQQITIYSRSSRQSRKHLDHLDHLAHLDFSSLPLRYTAGFVHAVQIDPIQKKHALDLRNHPAITRKHDLYASISFRPGICHLDQGSVCMEGKRHEEGSYLRT